MVAWFVMGECKREGKMRGQVRAAVLVAMMLFGVTGCRGDLAMPRDRVGALPFPGLLTHYKAADLNDLGVHRYGKVPRLLKADETSGGIIYTTRAGFLDVAHLRITVDTVRYCVTHLRAAIDRGETVLPLKTLEGSTFHVTLRYPAEWRGALEGSAQKNLADKVTLRAGQWIAYEMMTWHELATWFGYCTVPFIDEKPSAFSYDDIISHVVGLRISDAVLTAQAAQTFDQAVTLALREQLAELGAVSPKQTDAAAAAVEGVWWTNGRPLRRQVDVGEGGVVSPWLISALTEGKEGAPNEFQLPRLDDVDGMDFSSFVSVAVEPRILAAIAMRAQLPARPQLFDVERDFPALIAVVRSQMEAKYGSQVKSPRPAMTTPGVVIQPRRAVESRSTGPDRLGVGDGCLPTTRGIQG
jgi:hypothetical protein